MIRLHPWQACFLLLLLFPGTHASADLIVCKDGSVWGGKIRGRGGPQGGFRVETLEGVKKVPAGMVKQVRSRRKLLPLLRRFRSRLDLEKERDLLLLARWCRDHGLYDEMFDLYDRLGERHPEAAGFRAFVDSMARRIHYGAFQAQRVYTPGEGKALLEAAGEAGPTLKAIAEALIRAQPPGLRAVILAEGMASRRRGVKLLSIALAGAFTPEEGLKPLVRLVLTSRTGEVREAAIGALARYDRDGMLTPFIQALRSKNRAYRMNALEALAFFRDPRSVPALLALLGRSPAANHGAPRRGNVYVGNVISAVTGFEGRVATGAAAAEPKVSNILEGVVLDAGILSTHGVGVIRADERRRITAILASIAGVDYGDDYLLWKGWWEQHQRRALRGR